MEKPEKEKRPAAGSPSAGKGRIPAWIWVIGALAVAVFLLRMAAAVPFSRSFLIQHPVLEDADYQARAVEIRQGAVLDTHLPWGSPLYPYLAALAPGAAAGQTVPLASAQAVLEAATALLLMLWIRRRWGLFAAAAAGILYALDPLGAYFAARFSPVCAATLAWVGALWWWDHDRARPAAGIRGRLAWGLLVALGFLLQPLPFLLLLLLRGFLEIRNSAAALRARAALALGAMILPILLLAGIVLVQHSRIPQGGPALGWGGGPALDRAFNPATGGTPRGLHPPAWISQTGLETEVWENLQRQGGSYDVYRFYAARGFRRLVENPVRSLGVLLVKALATAGAFPIPDSLSPLFLAQRQAPLFAYLRFSFAVLLALGLAGLVTRKSDGSARTLAWGLGLIGAASLLGMASAAARQPALPLLAALGGAWAGSLREKDGRATGKGPLAALAAALVVSLLAGFFAPTSALREPSEDLRLVASTFSRAQDVRASVPFLEEAVERNPRNQDARVSLASAYQRDGLISAARQQLQAAYAIDSTRASTVLNMALLDEAGGNRKGAIGRLQRLLREHPNNPLYLNEYGRMLLLDGQFPEAYTALARAVRLKPDYTVAQQNLQVVETCRQRLEESFLPPAMRLAENDPLQGIFAATGQALEGGQMVKADSLIRTLERLRPDLVQPHWFRGGYCARLGQIPQAIQALETCVRLAPGRPTIVQQLAQLYEQSGHREKIGPLLLEAIRAADADSTRVQALLTLRAQYFGQPGISPPRKAGS